MNIYILSEGRYEASTVSVNITYEAAEEAGNNFIKKDPTRNLHLMIHQWEVDATSPNYVWFKDSCGGCWNGSVYEY